MKPQNSYKRLYRKKKNEAEVLVIKIKKLDARLNLAESLLPNLVYDKVAKDYTKKQVKKEIKQ